MCVKTRVKHVHFNNIQYTLYKLISKAHRFLLQKEIYVTMHFP